MKRTVLITGISGGIGAATAESFIREGWAVIGVDRVHPQATLNDGVTFFEADLADEKQVDALFAKLAQHGGQLDAVVNNAALQLCKPLLETTSAEWDAVMAANLKAVFMVMRGAYPLLRKPGGAIVNLGSVHARSTSKNIAAYAASKGGLESLTRVAALEFAVDGIRVNGVHPGAVDTQMLRAGLERGHLVGESSDDLIEKLAKRHPLGRVGTPEDVAEAVYFLAGDKTRFMTGTFLVLDGGVLAHLSSE